jgi:hypothetical protein
MELLVTLEGGPGSPASGCAALRRRSFAGACTAAKADAQCCVAVAADSVIMAGEQGTLQLRREDRCCAHAIMLS